MRRVVLAVVSTVAALVLVLSFKTHGAGSAAAASQVVSTPSPTASGSGSTGGTSKNAGGGSSSASSQTVVGDAVETQYGPVQVKVTVTGGKVTSVSAVEYPDTDPRDAQINSYAIPALNQEATAAGSADIDMVSGATYTSQGYIQSLQSALDKVTA